MTSNALKVKSSLPLSVGLQADGHRGFDAAIEFRKILLGKSIMLRLGGAENVIISVFDQLHLRGKSAPAFLDAFADRPHVSSIQMAVSDGRNTQGIAASGQCQDRSQSVPRRNRVGRIIFYKYFTDFSNQKLYNAQSVSFEKCV